MHFSDFSPETLEQWYRFALLLHGDPVAAEATLLTTCEKLAPALDGWRNDKARKTAVIRDLRKACLEQVPSEAPTSLIENPVLRAIAKMPEPDRSATALFYLKLLPVSEIAALLNLSMDELAGILERARSLLHEATVTVPNQSTSP